MRDDRLLARLAAANPVPYGVAADASVHERLRPSIPAGAREEGAIGFGPRHRRRIVAVLAAVAIAVPAAAFAHRIGQILGLSNQGTPIPTSELPQYQATKLAEAMKELQFPSQMQLLGERNGVSFYATQKANGEFCFAVDTTPPDATRLEAVACDQSRTFPSPERPVIGLPVGNGASGRVLAGFAADGVARVELIDDSGATIASAPVSENLYAAINVPGVRAAAIVAFDDQGNVLYRRPLG